MIAVTLNRVDPSRNMRRFYRLDVQPDLFGGVLLLKQWGRIGARRRIMAERYDDEALAVTTLQRQGNTNPLRHGIGHRYATWTEAFRRTDNDASGAVGPRSRNASGRSAAHPLPEASRPARQGATLAGRRGRARGELQEDYRAWLDALPESLRESATAEALRAVTEIDLSELESAEPPRGCGRDCARETGQARMSLNGLANPDVCRTQQEQCLGENRTLC